MFPYKFWPSTDVTYGSGRNPNSSLFDHCCQSRAVSDAELQSHFEMRTNQHWNRPITFQNCPSIVLIQLLEVVHSDQQQAVPILKSGTTVEKDGTTTWQN